MFDRFVCEKPGFEGKRERYFLPNWKQRYCIILGVLLAWVIIKKIHYKNKFNIILCLLLLCVFTMHCFIYSQKSNQLNQSRLKTLKAQDDHIKVMHTFYCHSSMVKQ